MTSLIAVWGIDSGASNNTASIVVKSSNLNQDQIAQIQNIVQRELGIESENINISKK